MVIRIQLCCLPQEQEKLILLSIQIAVDLKITIKINQPTYYQSLETTISIIESTKAITISTKTITREYKIRRTILILVDSVVKSLQNIIAITGFD